MCLPAALTTGQVCADNLIHNLQYTLRPAVQSDLELMMQIGHDGIRPYVEQQIQWDQSDQERRFREDFELDLISIITTDDGNIGYLKVERREDHIWLCGLYLDRDYRSRGIGSDIVSNLLAQCRSLQLPLRLRVLSQNPARHMYERLGFRVVEESGSHVYLEADPREV